MRATGLLLLLAACGPKLDPLVPMRSEVGEARQHGPGPHPHLTFAVDEATTLALVEQAAQLDHPRAFPLFMGAAATLAVHVADPDLTITARPGAPHVHLDVGGTFDATISSFLGTAKLADGLGFSGTLSGGLRLALEPGEDAQHIFIVPVPDDRFVATVQLQAEKGPLTDAAVGSQLDKLLEQAFAGPLQVGRIPHTVPLRAAALALQPAEDPTVAVWIQARPPKDAPPAVAPEGGFVIATTDDALLSGARAALATVEQHRTWKIEPRELHVEPESFEAVLRLHKVARRLKWRDYRVRGTLALTPDALAVRATEVDEIAKKGFGASLIGPFVKGRVRKEVLRVDLALPRATDQRVGKGGLTWTLERLRAHPAGVTVEGSVAPLVEETE
ncbi:MAG: hypothetical protein H6736_19580 [Alphaproteobacteria bacterium]|nr:hypothetical protein [Alphaproteobacteria bacterium]MCB9694014.1 hypothetical protein [Alphaproteobacteria bacterium]